MALSGQEFVPASKGGGSASSIDPAALAALNQLLVAVGAGTPGDVADLVKRLRHFYGVTTAVAYRFVQLNPSQPAPIAQANPFRIFLAYQLPLGVTAYEGQNVSLSIPPAGPQPGFQAPVGGGFQNGPEFTGALWLISASTALVTVKELSGDVAYP